MIFVVNNNKKSISNSHIEMLFLEKFKFRVKITLEFVLMRWRILHEGKSRRGKI